MVFKFKGFSIFDDIYQREHDRTNNISDFDDEGFNLQAGYFVIPQKLEVALRLSELDPNSDVDDNEREERGLALGYFFNKHNHKLQADYRAAREHGREPQTDKESACSTRSSSELGVFSTTSGPTPPRLGRSGRHRRPAFFSLLAEMAGMLLSPAACSCS